jgi:hypothetical protein
VGHRPLGQLINVHSGYCLIVTGSDPPVWLTRGDACTTALTSVADWTPRGGTWPVEEGTITNNHTGWYLDWDVDAGGTILQASGLHPKYRHK